VLSWRQISSSSFNLHFPTLQPLQMSHSLFDVWRTTVARIGNRPLLTDAATATVWSATVLDEAVDQIDAGLIGGDAWRGRIVLLALPGNRDWLVAFLLCLKRGAIPLPIDSDTPANALDRLVRELGAVALLSSTGWKFAGVSRQYPHLAAVAKAVPGPSGELAPLLFTADELLADLDQIVAGMGIAAADVNYGVVPMGHAYGLGNLVMPLLAHGQPLVLASSAVPHGIADDLGRFRPTVVLLVPTLLRALVKSEIPAQTFQSARLVLSAGDTLEAAVAQRFHERFARRIHNFYGTSETGGIAYDRDGGATLSGAGVGEVLPDVTVRRSPAGRLMVRSPAVFTIGNSEIDGAVGQHTVADHGVVGRDGVIALEGRERQLMKIAGRRFHPIEIETWLLSRLPLRQARVETMMDTHGETRCILRYEGDVSPLEIRRKLAEEFPAWKIPRRILSFDEADKPGS